MSAQVFTNDVDPAITSLLRDGAVGVIASDTVYGLAASASDAVAVSRLYGLKQRETNPGTIIAATIEQLETLGIKKSYLRAVAQFWPNPLSVVIPCDEKLAYLHLGKSSLAVRIPADDRLRRLLEQVGPLLTSSANQPGEPPAETIDEAKHYFGDAVDFYADSGVLHNRPPSTIIRVVDDAIEVLRQGAVTINDRGEIV